MGASGTGIFGDDLAADIRAEFRDLIAAGKSTTAATKQVLSDAREMLYDSDDAAIVWLSLAATQHSLGRLQSRVRLKALRIIDSNADLSRWRDDPRLLRNRKTALARLKKRLLSNQPRTSTPKPGKQPFAHDLKWPVGEVVAYEPANGKRTLLHIVARCGSMKAGYEPIFAVLDWTRKRLPSAAQIRTLPLRKDKCEPDNPLLISVICQTKTEFPAERLEWLGVVREPHTKRVNGDYYLTRWRELDSLLATS